MYSASLDRHTVLCPAFYRVLSKRFYMLEQRIFLLLEFHRLDKSFIETKHTFQRKFNIRYGPSNTVIKVLFENFQRTRNIYDDIAGNADRPTTKITEANVVVIQRII